MNSAERVATAISHKESDKLPVDFGATIVSSMHIQAYKNYLDHLGVKKDDFEVMFDRDQSAIVHEDLAHLFHTDIRGVYPDSMRPGTWGKQQWIDGEYEYAIDEWSTKWRKEVDGGLYFDIVENPLRSMDISVKDIKNFPWPDPCSNEDFDKMRVRAEHLYNTYGCMVFLENPLATIFDAPCRLRGHDHFYMDFLLWPEVAEALMDGMLEIQLDYYQRALKVLKGLPVIVRTSDDLATQSSLTISPETYRTLIKPRHKALFDGIKAAGDENVKIFFHCDGACRPLIPDFIEMGVDCLNPIEDTCVDMNLVELKKEFGKDITFWGAGTDTPGILRTGTPQEVADDVKKRIETLAPGGGYIFAAVHNLQPDIPPENIEMLWKTVGEYR